MLSKEPQAPISVRAAESSDLAAMAAIHAACFSRPWNEDAFAQLLADRVNLALVASCAGESAPQGLLVARAAAGEAELLTLGVLPSARGGGLGRALLTAAAAWCRSAGAASLYLEVEDGNHAALHLYRSFGAISVGNRPRYYENGGDAAILSLALSDLAPDDAASP
jgi:ribosomal-protein-alanine N-acetyltransferase